jgi:NhaP-type Na+/H+ or K+/H+ antiporter
VGDERAGDDGLGEERPSGQPAPEGLEGGLRVRRRREPRYGAFLTTGGVAGVLAAAVLALLVASPQEYSRGAVFGYLAVTLGLLGVLLGGLTAVLTSTRTRGRWRRSQRS